MARIRRRRGRYRVVFVLTRRPFPSDRGTRIIFKPDSVQRAVKSPPCAYAVVTPGTFFRASVLWRIDDGHLHRSPYDAPYVSWTQRRWLLFYYSGLGVDGFHVFHQTTIIYSLKYTFLITIESILYSFSFCVFSFFFSSICTLLLCLFIGTVFVVLGNF